DVGSLADAREVLAQSGADAVMVGRAHYGAPWLAGALAAEAQGRTPATPADICDYIISHYEDMLIFYGIEQGLRHARKHLGWYLDRHVPHTPQDLRRQAMTATEPGAVIAAIREAFARQPARNAA